MYSQIKHGPQVGCDYCLGIAVFVVGIVVLGAGAAASVVVVFVVVNNNNNNIIIIISIALCHVKPAHLR